MPYSVDPLKNVVKNIRNFYLEIHKFNAAIFDIFEWLNPKIESFSIRFYALFFLSFYNQLFINKSEESIIINMGQHLFNIISNSGKLYFTRIWISIVEEKDTIAKQNIREKQKVYLNVAEVKNMLFMAFKQNSKLDFELLFNEVNKKRRIF